MEEKRARASATANTMNGPFFRKIGITPLPSLPPGIVKAVAKVTVMMRVATTLHDDDVSFTHCLASLSNSWCCSSKTSQYVFPLSSFFSINFLLLQEGKLLSSSACIKINDAYQCKCKLKSRKGWQANKVN